MYFRVSQYAIPFSNIDISNLNLWGEPGMQPDSHNYDWRAVIFNWSNNNICTILYIVLSNVHILTLLKTQSYQYFLRVIQTYQTDEENPPQKPNTCMHEYISNSMYCSHHYHQQQRQHISGPNHTIVSQTSNRTAVHIIFEYKSHSLYIICLRIVCKLECK